MNDKKRCYLIPAENTRNATALKLFAVILMMLDHLAAYGFELPGIRNNVEILRLIGRMAAPLFLFFVVESLKHTRIRRQFLLRLYLAGAITGCCNMIVSAWLNNRLLFGNIYQSYVWVVIVALLLDFAISHFRKRNYRKAVAILVGGVVAIHAIHLWDSFLRDYSIISNLTGIDISWCWIIHRVSSWFIYSPRYVEYSVLYILLGIIWYYQKKKLHQCVTLVLFCILAFCEFGNGIPQFSFITGNQWAMIGAIIPILLYNGQYGSGYKYFFYIYYPAHCYLIAIVQCCYIGAFVSYG